MRSGRLALGALVLTLVVIGGGLVLFLNPSREAPMRSWPSDDALPADERSGYYIQADGAFRLALPGVYKGYRLYHTDSLHSEGYVIDDAGSEVAVPGKKIGTLTFVESGYRLRRADGSQATARRLTRQPFTVRDIRVERGDVALAGWLLQPSRPRGVGVVIVHGSGRSDRDNAWYVTLAARLARAGAVVILPDKRGSGRSGGHWWHADFEQLADDAAAWLERLRLEAPGLARTGYIGVSQGGRIAPIAAIRHGDAEFIAILSAAAVPQNQQLVHEIEADARAQGAPPWLARLLAPLFAQRVRNKRPEWWDAIGKSDPIEEWRAADVPLFIAYGRQDEDDNVPVARSVERIRAAFGEAPDVALHIYDNVGHGYIVRPELVILPAFLRDLALWLKIDADAASTNLTSHP